MDTSWSSAAEIAEAVTAGRVSARQVTEDALARMRQQEQPAPAAGMPEGDPIAGMFRDDRGLIDEIVEEAMTIREERPWRLPAGE